MTCRYIASASNVRFVSASRSWVRTGPQNAVHRRGGRRGGEGAAMRYRASARVQVVVLLRRKQPEVHKSVGQSGLRMSVRRLLYPCVQSVQAFQRAKTDFKSQENYKSE